MEMETTSATATSTNIKRFTNKFPEPLNNMEKSMGGLYLEYPNCKRNPLGIFPHPAKNARITQ
jgi:hypothetical protein